MNDSRKRSMVLKKGKALACRLRSLISEELAPLQEEQEVRRLRERLEHSEREAAFLRESLVQRGNRFGIEPGKIVWIFGAGRSGSTWLAAMMEEIKGHQVWFEPRVGSFFDPASFERYKGQNFILSSRYRQIWLSSIRNLVLDGAGIRFPGATNQGYLIIKEPGGSAGAEILMQALPESSIVLLVRDPRDVAASWLDADRKGGWQNLHTRNTRAREETQADVAPDAFVKARAYAYLNNVGNAKKAYDAHEGRKVLIKYEDLRADTLKTMRRLYAALDIEVEEEELARITEKHAWENIPIEARGKGKFYRKASPGGWQEDLTPGQIEIVEEVTAPLLKEFYPHTGV